MNLHKKWTDPPSTTKYMENILAPQLFANITCKQYRATNTTLVIV